MNDPYLVFVVIVIVMAVIFAFVMYISKVENAVVIPCELHVGGAVLEGSIKLVNPMRVWVPTLKGSAARIIVGHKAIRRIVIYVK